MASTYKKVQNHPESLAIMLPVYNEEVLCGPCIDAIVRVVKKLPMKSHIIVVDDGSRDNSSYILKEKKQMYSSLLTIITHKKNKGYGGATQSGIQEAIKKRFTWLLHMDADMTNDPKYIPAFLRAATNQIDCVKASRYIRGSKVINVSVKRRVVSLVGNYVAHFLFGVGVIDCTNGFRMVRVEKLRKLKFKEHNFSIILEELYYLKQHQAKFKEIPYTLTTRTSTVSHFSYKPQIFIDYFKYAFLSFFA